MAQPLSKRWRIAPTIPLDFTGLNDYPPVLRQFLHNRDILDSASAARYLNSDGAGHDPYLLKGMQAAVDRLSEAIQRGETVAVYGDYDVDGVTATVLLTEVLRALGASAEPYIPDRFEEGYGLNNMALDKLAAQGVRLVITVDCGVRSLQEVAYGCQLGIDLIVSDHHAPLDGIPGAVAVICQHQEECTYPDKNLAGVGLAYKVAQALIQRFPQHGLDARDWLDLVALGTVADVVPLTGENRALVKTGLDRIRAGKRVGLVSLANAAGVDWRRCTASEIGFALGPRLNAAGRLESAMAAVNLLLSKDIYQAGYLAQQLDNQNRARQQLTRSMQLEAEGMDSCAGDELILFAFADEEIFNSGVVGLVAARVAESRYRPAVVGSIGADTTRASCRSIPEFHITRALDECADLLVRHGGHAKAAGFTVRNENRPALVDRLCAIARRELGGLDLRPVLRADMEIRLEDLKTGLFFDIQEKLEPTGHENPEAVYVSRGVEVVSTRPVGQDKTHLKLVLKDRAIFDAIAFRQGHWYGHLPARIDILYTLEHNTFNGRETVQLNIRDLKPAGMQD